MLRIHEYKCGFDLQYIMSKVSRNPSICSPNSEDLNGCLINSQDTEGEFQIDSVAYLHSGQMM
jgi:hypothetical protein